MEWSEPSLGRRLHRRLGKDPRKSATQKKKDQRVQLLRNLETSQSRHLDEKTCELTSKHNL